MQVADSGPGIPDDALPHVFDRLWRGREHRDAAGSGIGLAVVRELVTAHDLALSMHMPTGWDPYFTPTMNVLDVYHFGTQHGVPQDQPISTAPGVPPAVMTCVRLSSRATPSLSPVRAAATAEALTTGCGGVHGQLSLSVLDTVPRGEAQRLS